MSAAFSDPAGIDSAMMRHALVLARRGLGRTWPNPSVGAVIWRMEGDQPVILGRGATQKGGRPHAETEALAMAGEAARGASMAVTLEPCSHHGKTPPCAEAIVNAGIARVVSALEDPDPRVKGSGHALLRHAGIDVVEGVCAAEAARVNRGFLLRVLENRPFITLKLARTADGYAGADGKPLMISSALSKQRVHLQRAAHDAIMVGVGTVIADDPDLTCRLPGMMPYSPVRIIVDTDAMTPPGARVVETSAKVPTLIVIGEDADAEREAVLRAKGVDLLRVQRNAKGHVDLAAMLHALAGRGFTRIFSEGGPSLAEALAAEDCLDEIDIVTSPNPLGRVGILAVRPGLERAIEHSARFVKSSFASGRDTITHYERR
jgi:diaminohydroxyphosphoribosylaminopyrimidine deaminase / 5-amino-6-(5-phosphoribosylamino)uracil reductase